MDANESRKKLWGLIKDVKFTMMVTEQDDGTLRSRPMATQQAEFDGDLWFFTYVDSNKVHEINHHHQVNLSYADTDDQRYISVSGVAELVRDRAKLEELWNPVYKAWFPKGLDDPNIGLIKVRVTNAEYWDSTAGRMTTLVGYVKQAVTGQPYQPSEEEHKKLKVS